METAKITYRGLDAKKQQTYVDAITKEEKLRLKWFRNNEEKFIASVEKQNIRVSPQEKEELKENRRKFFEGAEKFPNVKVDINIPPADTFELTNIMRPVDPETKKLLYSGANQDGRVNYLRERVKIIPENRYYFPEVTSFVHGWKMWDNAKITGGSRFGKSAIIKQSFYRRRGAERDPDWYRAPAQLSPTVCTDY